MIFLKKTKIHSFWHTLLSILQYIFRKICIMKPLTYGHDKYRGAALSKRNCRPKKICASICENNLPSNQRKF